MYHYLNGQLLNEWEVRKNIKMFFFSNPMPASLTLLHQLTLTLAKGYS